ncbi:hypothetical protein [Novosphingobium sp.]|uniref:hypothetical protein n=1 Tax=Novosphingobium sp. TaxID=1874826 RepID=UPI00286DA295|nr:hypothetical protein [Novosphingobium sp.]
MIDLSPIVAGSFALSTAYFVAVYKIERARAERWKTGCNTRDMAISDLRSQVLGFHAERDARNAHLKRIASAGAKASNAKRKAARKSAVAKTIAAMPSLTMRTRAQVVAPVKAKRTRKKAAATT